MDTIANWIGASVSVLALGSHAYRRYRIERLQGPVPLRVNLEMLVHTLRTPKQERLFGNACILLLAIAGLFGIPFDYPPGVLLAGFVGPLATLLWFAAPPSILFLSASHPESGQAFDRIRRAIAPLRVTALLAPGIVPERTFLSSAWDNLRTRTDTDHNQLLEQLQAWQRTVHALAKLAPVIVVDTRIDNEAVRHELEYVMTNYPHRGVLIIKEDGAAPVIDALSHVPSMSKACRVTESEMAPVSVNLTRSRGTLPSVEYPASSGSRSQRPLAASGYSGSAFRDVLRRVASPAIKMTFFCVALGALDWWFDSPESSNFAILLLSIFLTLWIGQKVRIACWQVGHFGAGRVTSLVSLCVAIAELLFWWQFRI